MIALQAAQDIASSVPFRVVIHPRASAGARGWITTRNGTEDAMSCAACKAIMGLFTNSPRPAGAGPPRIASHSARLVLWFLS